MTGNLMQSKVVVVTGAFGALGRAVVEAALQAGARVAAIDLAPAPADSRATLALGGVDLSDEASAGAAMAQVAETLGGIDALLNVAGGFTWETVADGALASWERMQRLNLVTALVASRAALPYLARSAAGRIVNVGALGALSAKMGMGAYAASKAGVHKLTEALAEELKGRITVNAVLPSIIDTPANRADMPDADHASWVTPQEVAGAMLLLASEAAGGITGALVPVPGRV
jgi:NAD(P)-dependent dehydrogenase (short-subunit alcohol dehydrogenase family)